MRNMLIKGLGAALVAGFIANGAGAQTPADAAALEHADYGKGENWLCLPGRQDACVVPMDAAVVAPNGSMQVEKFKVAKNPAIDCFYVYPTVSLDNYSLSDLVPGIEERAVIERQFARLSSVCRPFAPMYRQVTLPQLRAAQGTGEAPPKRGVQGQGNVDVDEAWDYYMKNYNNGRGVVILGHSQGAGQISRLIKTKIEGTPAQKQLISAYILGGVVVAPKGQEVGGTFKSIGPCKSKDQIGCFVSYGSFRDTLPPAPSGQAVGAGPGTGAQGENRGLCVNPAALLAGKPSGPATADSYWAVAPAISATTKAPPRWNAKEPIYENFAKTPGLVTTECVDKNNRTYLQVHVNADANDPRGDDVYADVMTPTGPSQAWGLHNLDVPLHMGDIVKLVALQSATYLKGK